jgi:hypothetical protein
MTWCLIKYIRIKAHAELYDLLFKCKADLFLQKIKVLPSDVRKLEVSLLQVTMAMNFNNFSNYPNSLYSPVSVPTPSLPPIIITV